MNPDTGTSVRRVRRALTAAGLLFGVCLGGLYLSLAPELTSAGIAAPSASAAPFRHPAVVAASAAGIVLLPLLAVAMLLLVWRRERRRVRETELRTRDLELQVRDKELAAREAELRTLETRQRHRDAPAEPEPDIAPSDTDTGEGW